MRFSRLLGFLLVKFSCLPQFATIQMTNPESQLSIMEPVRNCRRGCVFDWTFAGRCWCFAILLRYFPFATRTLLRLDNNLLPTICNAGKSIAEDAAAVISRKKETKRERHEKEEFVNKLKAQQILIVKFYFRDLHKGRLSQWQCLNTTREQSSHLFARSLISELFIANPSVNKTSTQHQQSLHIAN